MAVFALVAVSCSFGSKSSNYATPPPGSGVPKLSSQVVTASWYGPDFHGKLTASGERYDMDAMTAAHKTLPFGTRLRVTRISNKKSVLVTVTDRGPFVKGRGLDLSRAAAKRLDMLGPGTARVRLKVLGRDMKYVKYIKTDAYPALKGPFTVQVASFTERFNAVHLQKGLQLYYKGTYVSKAKVGRRKFYRVRVGKFRSRDKADKQARKLAKDGYAAAVVPYK